MTEQQCKIVEAGQTFAGEFPEGTAEEVYQGQGSQRYLNSRLVAVAHSPPNDGQGRPEKEPVREALIIL
jgi:hypothetical protein